VRFQKEELFVFMLSGGKCRLLGLETWVWHRRLTPYGKGYAQLLGEKGLVGMVVFLFLN